MMALLMAACTSEPEGTLPTLAQLPTDAPQAVTLTPTSAPPDPEEAQVSVERTIPATFTETATVTVTASQTITDTPSPTATNLPTLSAEDRPLMGLMDYAAHATILPDNFFPPDLTPLGPPPTTIPVTVTGVSVISTQVGGSSGGGAVLVTPITSVIVGTSPASTCQYSPSGGFGTVFNNNADIARQLGCPLGNPPVVTQVNGALQLFQQGQMRWLEPGDIYVFYNSGSYQYYTDTFIEGTDPQTSSEAPPQPGLEAPVRGFLKVWSSNPSVRDGLGWGTTSEESWPAVYQDFAHGRMIAMPGRGEILVLIGDVRGSGTWRTVAGQY